MYIYTLSIIVYCECIATCCFRVKYYAPEITAVVSVAICITNMYSYIYIYLFIYLYHITQLHSHTTIMI